VGGWGGWGEKGPKKNPPSPTYDVLSCLINCLEGFSVLLCLQAVGEPDFSVPCARLCDVLQRVVVRKKKGAYIVNSIDFRKIMIALCQKEFDRDYTTEGRRLDKKKYEENAETPEEQFLQFQVGLTSINMRAGKGAI
jgi:hypothetical protein